MSAYSMGPPNGYNESLKTWSLHDCPVYNGVASGRRATSLVGRLSPMMRKKWTRVEAVREIAQNMCDACVMSLSKSFLQNLSSGIHWKVVPVVVPLDSEVRGWKFFLNGIYAAEVSAFIDREKDGQHTAKVAFYNRGRAIPAEFFLPNTTDKTDQSVSEPFLVGGFGQGMCIENAALYTTVLALLFVSHCALIGLKDAIATLMDESAMHNYPIQSIAFFGYSPRSPVALDNGGDYRSTARKRFMLKRCIKPKHTMACDMGLDEKHRTLQVCFANSHDKMPKPAKLLFQGDVPGTLVSFQFEPMSLADSKHQLDLIMHAFQSHILFDDIAEGVDVEMAKGPQPSKVFTKLKNCEDIHSQVFIFPGLLLSTPDTPDKHGFSIMLSKKDLGSFSGRERFVHWKQIQKKFVRAVSTAAIMEISANSKTCVVASMLLFLQLILFISTGCQCSLDFKPFSTASSPKQPMK